MIRMEILELFYIWKLVNRIRRSIISTGTSATKQRRRFPYPRQIKRKPTQRYDRSYRIVIQMEKCLGPNKSLLLWFYQSDTGTSSLHRLRIHEPNENSVGKSNKVLSSIVLMSQVVLNWFEIHFMINIYNIWFFVK